MKIPSGSRKRALIVVDVQPSFLTKRNEYIATNILKLLNVAKYDIYIEATFHAEKGSLWDIQQNWTCPEGKATETVAVISNKLKKLRAVPVKKETKSVFKGNKNLSKLFKERGIREIHIVGFDSNDCVLATAYEAFDLGFITYVIEECSEASGSKALHECGIDVLRAQNMTNNSCVEKVDFLKII